MANSKTLRIAFWLATSFFCLWMLFTAYAQLELTQVKQVFAHLGFPDYFRVELSVAKILGVVGLLAPIKGLFKEWIYAGFAITLASAFIAHLSAGDGPAIFLWPLTAGAVLGLSYFFYRKSLAVTTVPASNTELAGAH